MQGIMCSWSVGGYNHYEEIESLQVFRIQIGYKHYKEDTESLPVVGVLQKSVLIKILIRMCEQCTY